MFKKVTKKRIEVKKRGGGSEKKIFIFDGVYLVFFL